MVKTFSNFYSIVVNKWKNMLYLVNCPRFFYFTQNFELGKHQLDLVSTAQDRNKFLLVHNLMHLINYWFQAKLT